MRYTHILGYSIEAIPASSLEQDVVLLNLDSINTRVILTSNPESHFYIIDRGLALILMMMTGGFNQHDSHKFASRLEEKIEQVQRSWKEDASNHAVLVVEVSGEVEADVQEPLKDFGEYVLCFNAVDKDLFRIMDEDIITGIVASLSLAIGMTQKIENLRDASFLIDENGKIIYTTSPSVNPIEVTLSRPMRDEIVHLAESYASTLVFQTELATVARLLIQSLDRRADNLKAFISGWTALEIFTNKVFKEYEGRFIDELQPSSTPSGPKELLDRISKVMKDKYTLTDKFNLISYFLGRHSSSQDLGTFKEIKRIRDGLLHGGIGDVNQLPVSKLHKLLLKYLSEHLTGASK